RWANSSIFVIHNGKRTAEMKTWTKEIDVHYSKCCGMGVISNCATFENECAKPLSIRPERYNSMLTMA
ncbi:hypothetical protein PFISCL1PPCAC_17148, partial [Pristionchus fissidentatus]